MGGERNGVGGGLLQVPHRPGTLPAGREDLPAQGAQPLQHGGGESRLRHGYRETGRRCGAERGTFDRRAPSYPPLLTFLRSLQLRKAIEDANAGILPMHADPHLAVSSSSIAKSETDTESKNASTMNSIASVGVRESGEGLRGADGICVETVEEGRAKGGESRSKICDSRVA